MATPQALGDVLTASAPRLHNGMIWFQGADNRLMVMPMDDPSKAFNPGGLKTLSEPVPVRNLYMSFRGEDDRLMLVTADPPYLHGQLGGAKCLSAPVPCGPYLYFQGPGNSLARCRLDRDGQEPIVVDGQPIAKGCTGRPAISAAHRDQLMYPAGEAALLYGVDIKVGDYKVTMPSNASNLYTEPNGTFWCVHSGRLTKVPFPLWQHRNFAAFADPIRPCVMPYGNDAFIYYVLKADLYRCPKKNIYNDVDGTLLAKGCATSPEVQPGFVLYGGTDKKIYKLAL